MQNCIEILLQIQDFYKVTIHLYAQSNKKSMVDIMVPGLPSLTPLKRQFQSLSKIFFSYP